MQIRVRNLNKIFPGRRGDGLVVALKDVDLEVRRGEFVTLLGPSGCGKSTLLSILAGFQQATSGEALHDGAPITAPDARRTVVFQDYALFAWKTVQ